MLDNFKGHTIVQNVAHHMLYLYTFVYGFYLQIVINNLKCLQHENNANVVVGIYNDSETRSELRFNLLNKCALGNSHSIQRELRFAEILITGLF